MGGQLTVLLNRSVHDMNHILSKCFPGEECKCENIKKELEDNAKTIHDKATVEVSCEKVENDKEDEGDTEAPTKMSKACHDALAVLEEREKGNNQEEGHGKTCKK